MKKNESLLGSLFAAILSLLFGMSTGVLCAQEFASRGVTPETPLSFVYDGETLRTFPDERCLLRTEQTRVDKGGSAPNDRFPRAAIKTKITERTDHATGLKITTETVTYADFPEVVEQVTWLENRSDKNTPNLRDVAAFDVTLDVGGSARLWHGMGENSDPKLNFSCVTEPLEVGKPLEFSPREAYPSYFAFPYFRVLGERSAYILAIGWVGAWSASFQMQENGTVHFRAGQKTVDLYLKPGEKIRTPRITLFRCAPDADCVNLWRRWFREYIMPRENGQVLPPKLVLDAHAGGELYKDITEQQQIESIRKMRSLGLPCEGLWIDAGWYLRRDAVPTQDIGYWFGVGDWTPDPERFPNGLKPLADELGPDADFTLWYEPERIHRDAATFSEYQKYVIPDKELVCSYRMNMASDETVAFLSDLIGRSLRENGVKIYRQDSNGAGPGPFLEHLEQTDPNFADRRGLAENLYVRGYLTFWANLKAMNPGLIIDTCASGGRRNDLDTLRMGAVPLHYSDVGYNDFIEKQHYHDLLDQWFIYYKNIDGHDWDSEKNELDPYRTTVDLAAFSTISPNVFAHDTPVNRRYVERFLAVRDDLVYGDYYLLRGGFSADSWTVAQYHDAAKNRGFLRVVRNPENGEDTITVALRSLDPETLYAIENLDTGAVAQQTGRDLTQTGLALAQPKRSGEIIRYQKAE